MNYAKHQLFLLSLNPQPESVIRIYVRTLQMKYLITIIIAVMVIATTTAQEIDKMALRMAVEHQFANYPESTLQDVYKAFYQEHFGPEHMISDTAAVRNYLDRELATMGNERGSLYYEPIGIDGNYVRVYLSAVKDNLITADELLQAFLDSAAARQEPTVEWATKWNAIVEVINEIKPGFGNDIREDLQQASLDNQAVHHSSAYNAAYHPHYRIIDRTIFEMQLKPFIDK